jgi:eukaryotic-like serine/threonine-protein kinase
LNRLLWQRVESTMQQALAVEPAARSAFVAAIADAEVRTEVESLLAADAGALDRLEQAISATASRLIEVREARPIGSQFSHYRLLELLGAGGISQVYLAEDLHLKRKVALKFLPAAFSQDPARVRRFEREARAASALNHPNIVITYEIGNVDEQWFIAMEYVPGEPLSARISRGAIPVREALEIADQMAAALSETHKNGILHRDIKPANIMLRNDGLVKLVDFGVARLDPAVFEGGQTTYSGKLLGTPAYMSPEQAKGLPLNSGSDLWSLGAVLYEMVTGTRAFRASESPEILVAILSRRPVAPSKKVPSIPPALDVLIMKLLSQSAAARYSSADEVRLAIAEIRSSLTPGLVRKFWRRIFSVHSRQG